MPKFLDDSTFSVQERAIQNLIELIRDMEDPDVLAGDPPEPTKLWKNVFRGDPDDNPQWNTMNCPFVAVDDGDTSVVGQMIPMHVDKEMNLLVHFRFVRGSQVEEGTVVDPYTVYNYYLARLQETILTDYRLGGTIRDVFETSSAPQIFREDNMQGGFLALTLRFAHQRENPFTTR